MPPKSGMSAKRIAKELKEVEKELPEGIRAGLKNTDNLFEWYAQIDGPADSVYEGGVFDIDISVPADYPFRPPRAQFRTRVYHMNINAQGGICLDILKTAWSPALSVMKVILSILSLLTDPNPNDPLVGDIARQYMSNRPAHDTRARSETKQYAKPEFAVPAVKKVVPAPKLPASNLDTALASATPAATVNASSTSSSKGKGKEKEKEKKDNSKPIVIDDDDDDLEVSKATIAGGSKKRAASSKAQEGGNKSAKMQRTGSSTSTSAGGRTVIELD